MNELELIRIDLDNLIGGLEISKAINVDWRDDDERELALMYRIRDLLKRVEPKEEKCFS